MSSADLAFRAVSRQFGATAGVTDVTLVVPAGQVTVLLGASGSGKSTLLRLAAGLERCDRGEIWLGSTPLDRPHHVIPPEQRRIGLVFQDFALFPHLTALGNVAFGLRTLDRPERAKRAMAWLDRVGLAAQAKAYPQTLSGGEQLRVALARALAPEPRVVLLDEPFSGLDPTLRLGLRLSALAAITEAGAGALLVTHDADEALQSADQLAVLAKGRLIQAGPAAEIATRPASLAAASALGPLNLWRGVVRNGRLDTPFGALPTVLADGTAAVAAVRPEALRLTPGTTYLAQDVRPLGLLALVRVQSQGVVWEGRAEGGVGHQEAFNAQLLPQGSFVFPDDT
jgi:iron(III) transport system ATP-binding protein